jgi:RNA methyltransferase, TrmH family
VSSSFISSKSNPLVQKAIRIREGKDEEFLFIEGESLFDEAVHSPLVLTDIFCLKEKQADIRKTLALSKYPSCRIHVLSDSAMKMVSDVRTPPGVVVIAKRPQYDEKVDQLTLVFLVLVLHRVQLPQNVGALLRTAEAAGVSHVWTTNETADPFSPKGIRGSMGSVFHMRIRSGLNLSSILPALQEEGFTVVAATREGKCRYDLFDWKRKVALVVGNEAAGFSDLELKTMDSTLTIPMAGRADSLNVGVAGGICLFEAFRQRGFKPT